MKWYPGYKPQFELGFGMFKELRKCPMCVNGNVLDKETKKPRKCTICSGLGMVKKYGPDRTEQRN